MLALLLTGCAHPKRQQVWRIELKHCATVAEHLICECKARQVLNAKTGQYYIECD